MRSLICPQDPAALSQVLCVSATREVVTAARVDG